MICFILLLEEPVKALLSEQCEDAKNEMKAAPVVAGIKAVTVADGAWLTRGHHSQNFTFHV